MSFRRLKMPFDEYKWGGVLFTGACVVLVNSSSHYGQLVKIGCRFFKTSYTHVYPDKQMLDEIYSVTEELNICEIRRLRHHMTRRIWMLDGVFECINWKILRNLPDVHGKKLLPPVICYDCMKEGNKYIPSQLKRYGRGLCRCCQNPDTNLYFTAYGWPLDLRHKGFNFTVIATGINYTMNEQYYKKHFDMSIYSDYNGQLIKE